MSESGGAIRNGLPAVGQVPLEYDDRVCSDFVDQGASCEFVVLLSSEPRYDGRSRQG
ncbi:hypothetical protein ACFWZT_03775 [Streptomyces alboflavus]|uniref:hypothetical protein n=1 Tax=Streptomyces alboflavus TaxID=67267 RepID=UPI00369DE60E